MTACDSSSTWIVALTELSNTSQWQWGIHFGCWYVILRKDLAQLFLFFEFFTITDLALASFTGPWTCLCDCYCPHWWHVIFIGKGFNRDRKSLELLWVALAIRTLMLAVLVLSCISTGLATVSNSILLGLGELDPLFVWVKDFRHL